MCPFFIIVIYVEKQPIHCEKNNKINNEIQRIPIYTTLTPIQEKEKKP